jgi:nitrogen fixation/metabolism regulation signal transduction histidine kinase
MDQSNIRMAQFLQAVRHADFSQSFKRQDHGKSFVQLNDAFNEVIQDFQQIRREREENYRYLQTVVQHVGVGLLAFDDSGKVELINSAAKKLLGVTVLRNISSLKTLSRDLYVKLSGMKSGGRSLIKIQRDDDLLQLSAFGTEFQLRGKSLKLISLQNIQSELEEQEMEAWQKLIRVLTHEIMNSITPISSLAKTVDESLNDINTSVMSTGDLKDIRDAVNTIHKRSEGLIHFVESYRKLTKIPQPNFEMISVNAIIQNVPT